MSTTAIFNHIDMSAQLAGTTKPWSKVDGAASSFKMEGVSRPVHDLRSQGEATVDFGTDVSGFGTVRWPSAEKEFVDDKAVRGAYYDDVEALLRANCEALPSNSGGNGKKNKVQKVVFFDHTIRRRLPDAARAPVQQVHVDQTAAAAAARVRRHLPASEAEEFLASKRRFQLINVWRPIGHPASDHPLAVIDWRSTVPDDFVPVDLLYPKSSLSSSTANGEEDYRGKEVRPEDDEAKKFSTEGYEVKGETMAVRANKGHKFFYVKDMTPDEALLLKCYDSWGEGEPQGKKGLAVRTPHTAFEDPDTPKDAKPRQSIEVRALVFYEE
jgi:hypothetical protein